MDLITDIVTSPLVCCGWLIIGAIAGALARRVMGAKDRPLLSDIILGLIGALVGGFIASLVNIGGPESGLGLVFANLLIATFGAMVLIAIGRMLRGSR